MLFLHAKHVNQNQVSPQCKTLYYFSFLLVLTNQENKDFQRKRPKTTMRESESTADAIRKPRGGLCNDTTDYNDIYNKFISEDSAEKHYNMFEYDSNVLREINPKYYDQGKKNCGLHHLLV